MRFTTSFFILLFVAWPAKATDNAIIQVGIFSKNDLSNWEVQEFDGTTQYTLGRDDGRNILKANSHGSASGLVKKVQIDLYKTPYINWQWKVNNSLFISNESEKAGDDYAARVYIVIDGGMFFWRTLALNYVWASNKKIDELWSSPYTSNVKMIAVESGSALKKQWLTEKRNVREDLKEAFGREFRFIDAIAIMTDTDNSQQRATAYYGDIYFSEE